jgi:hypothetical protein
MKCCQPHNVKNTSAMLQTWPVCKIMQTKLCNNSQNCHSFIVSNDDSPLLVHVLLNFHIPQRQKVVHLNSQLIWLLSSQEWVSKYTNICQGNTVAWNVLLSQLSSRTDRYHCTGRNSAASHNHNFIINPQGTKKNEFLINFCPLEFVILGMRGSKLVAILPSRNTAKY